MSMTPSLLLAVAALLPGTRVPSQVRGLDVVLEVTRIAGGEGEALVSNTIPLRPGDLMAPRVAALQLVVDGRPVPSYIAALPARHADGSVRAILVQFTVAIRAGEHLRAMLQEASGKPQRQPEADFPLIPEAVVLPVDPEYLIATNLVGPTVPVSVTRRWGGTFERYEGEFQRWSETHWNKTGASWSGGNYYDRAQIYYAWWVRTGRVEYWRRGTMMAVDYRTDYLEKNKMGSSHHWAQLEGVALHYLLSGDPRSRTAVGHTAEVLGSYFRRGVLGDTSHRDMENRIQARSLLAALLAWEIQADGKARVKAADWERLLPEMLGQILPVQGADGAFRFGSICGASLNYMSALLDEALIRYHDRFREDSLVARAIRANADWMWATQWRRGDRSFNYQSAFCPKNRSGPTASVDLNGLFVSTYGWLYRRTGDRRYRDAADEILGVAVRAAFLKGTKQFNQQYSSSYRYFGYRAGRDP